MADEEFPGIVEYKTLPHLKGVDKRLHVLRRNEYLLRLHRAEQATAVDMVTRPGRAETAVALGEQWCCSAVVSVLHRCQVLSVSLPVVAVVW